MTAVAPGAVRAEAGRIARLAAPIVLTQVATVLMGLADTMIVARLGTEALAATALGSVWVFGTLVLAMGVLFGLDPIVTQAHGAGDGERAALALQRGLVLAVLLSIPVTVAWLLTEPVLRLAGQSPELARLAHRYTVVQIPSIAPFLAYTALRQYLTGRGVVAPAMWVAWVANVVNVLANWVLVFGHLGAPALGVPGSGIATAISRVFMLAGLVALVRWGGKAPGPWPAWRWSNVGPGRLVELLRHGLPAAAQIGLEVWGFQVATLLAGRLGPTQLAAHTIVLNLASLTFMVPFGVAMAAATRVGNSIGAGDLPGARRAARVALVLGAGFMSAAAVLFVLLRWTLPRAWMPAPEVLAAAAAILPIAGAFQVFDGTQTVGCGVLRGRGDLQAAAWFNLLGYYGLGLPLGWILAYPAGLGLPGLWWGLTAGLTAVALLLLYRVLRRD